MQKKLFKRAKILLNLLNSYLKTKTIWKFPTKKFRYFSNNICEIFESIVRRFFKQYMFFIIDDFVYKFLMSGTRQFGCVFRQNDRIEITMKKTEIYIYKSNLNVLIIFFFFLEIHNILRKDAREELGIQLPNAL